MTISPRKPDRTRHPTFYSAKCTAIGLCCFIALALPGCTTLPASAPADQAPATADTNVTHGAAPAGKDHADSVADEKPSTTVNDDHVIYFPIRVAIVDDAGRKKLRQHAEYLKQNPKTVVTLVGYVDDAGSRSYNTWRSPNNEFWPSSNCFAPTAPPASRFVATAIKRNPNVYQPPVSKTCVGWNWFTPLDRPPGLTETSIHPPAGLFEDLPSAMLRPAAN